MLSAEFVASAFLHNQELSYHVSFVVQLLMLSAEFVASAFLHNQELIFKVHERNKLWVVVDWHCISHLDCTYWRRVVYTGEIVRRGCTSNGHVLHSDASCY